MEAVEERLTVVVGAGRKKQLAEIAERQGLNISGLVRRALYELIEKEATK